MDLAIELEEQILFIGGILHLRSKYHHESCIGWKVFAPKRLRYRVYFTSLALQIQIVVFIISGKQLVLNIALFLNIDYFPLLTNKKTSILINLSGTLNKEWHKLCREYKNTCRCKIWKMSMKHTPNYTTSKNFKYTAACRLN